MISNSSNRLYKKGRKNQKESTQDEILNLNEKERF